MSFESLKEVILNNLGLRSFCIGEKERNPNVAEIISLYPLGELMKVFIDSQLTMLDILHRFASRCHEIEQLKCFRINGKHDEIFKAIESFEHIESLLLTIDDFEYSLIESLVKNLSLLRHLHIDLYVDVTNPIFVLMLLSKCPVLEKLTIIVIDANFEIFTNVQFFDVFNEWIQMQNVIIELGFGNKIFGTITKSQVI